MKRILLLFMVGLVTLGLIACQVSEKPKTSLPDTTNQEELKEDQNISEDDADKNVDIYKTAVIYFGDSEAMGLNGEERNVEAISPETLINELIKGPQIEGNHKTIPDGTKLLGIEIKNGTAYVDFSKELKDNHWGGSSGESITLYSIVNTLVLQPDLKIERVQILIEGQTIETLAGHMDTTMPLEPNLEMVSITFENVT